MSSNPDYEPVTNEEPPNVKQDNPEAPVKQDDPEEVTIDLSDCAPEHHDTITISVTDGATEIETFDYAAPPELSVLDLRAGLLVKLHSIDDTKRIRHLIFRGQMLRDTQTVADTKLQPGDKLQMLTALNTVAPPPPPEPAAAPAIHGSPRSLLMELGMMQAHTGRAEQHVHPQVGGSEGMEMQEEVERWGSRVKIWTCLLLLLYSFKLLVGLSQSMEQRQDKHAPTLAFDLLGFWVAYIGARAATRLNLALARGYLYGQVMVAVCNMFMIATRDPKLSTQGEQIPGYMVWVSLMVNAMFWGYVVYTAFRFQKALFAWFSQFHPDLIIEQNSDM